MSELVIQALITVGGSFASMIFTVILAVFLTRLNRKTKENGKDVNKGTGTTNKIDSKAIKDAPVTLNTDKIFEFIVDAESHPDFTGIEKLDYVVTKFQQYCMDNKFKFDKELIVECVNKVIDITKKVNKRDKDTVTDEEPVQLNI